ncbi:GNAT family N-acetyltransferase [Sulfitobacter sp. D35]|uniref:GNAT family N-acetyltransferase n=1 Tax=Sulfitobacter sp. D35 TaxID=3083252 RepID=UPI00296FDA61|nr:GNAT family N-acetyltransferase [Sulfitobacter sp. D35]MDW4497299.1 GNAT family N-acetyltransferase [Sulfitobacter sp. D35]
MSDWTTPLPCETPAQGPALHLAARVAGEIPEIWTERLLLCAPRIGDFPDYAEIVCGPRGKHFGSVSRDEAWLDFAQMVAGWVLRGHGLWTVTLRADASRKGFVLLGFEPEDREPELGYMLCDGAEGEGYATEAAAAVRDHAARAYGWTTLVSYVARDNHRSAAVAERLGAVLDPDALPDDDETLVYRHDLTRRAA